MSDPEVYNITLDLLRDLLSFFLCPEVQAWIRTSPDSKIANEMVEKCKEVIRTEVGIGEDRVLTPESIFELFINEDSKVKKSRLIQKLRELFATEVTRKVNEIVKSLNKKK